MRQAAPRDGLGRAPIAVQWIGLVGVSAMIAAGLEALGIPAALLLGPMVAAILASVGGAAIAVPGTLYTGAQAIVGLMIASTFKPSTVATVGQHWAVFLSVVVATYVSSFALGYAMSRTKVLPGSTAVWGSAPGAASAMMLMAEAFGADPRLVAFMQYTRVVFVALAASLVARIWVGSAAIQRFDLHAFLPPIAPVAFAETVLFAAATAAVGRWSRLPAGPLLVPMVVGGVLRATGLIVIDLPPWLLAASYAFVGWKIGLGFTRDVLSRAARAVVPMIANVLILILLCGGFAMILVRGLGIDPLTAYLATSPGGMDSVAIIGATTKVDLPFVMALHAMRFFIVLTTGPATARLVARLTERD